MDRAGSFGRGVRRRRSGRVLIALGVLVAIGAVGCDPAATCPALAAAADDRSAAAAANASRATGLVERHAIAADDLGVERLAGLTWSTEVDGLVAVEAVAGDLRGVVVDPTGEDAGATIDLPATATAATLSDDRRGGGLAVLDGTALAQVGPGAAGDRVDVGATGVQRVRAAGFAPTGRWVALADGGRRAVVVDQARGTATPLSLGGTRPATYRAVAVHPTTGQVYLAGDDQRLYVHGAAGRLERTFALADLALADLRAMTIGPSADRTDAAATQSLYLADAGSGPGTGSIREVAVQADAPAPAAANLTSQLVATRNTSGLNPPSPDPSGITAIGSSLLISDGEVEEMSIYRGANLFQVSRTGALQTTGLTLPDSDEPTGLGHDPGTGRLFVSDDDADEIYIFRAGADGRFGTGDDQRSSFDTRPFGNTDAEGVAFDTSTGSVFIVDGVNKEVFRRAANGAWTQFDVGTFGAVDPEGIDYDASRGTLLVVDDTAATVYELSTTGSLVRAIDVSAANAYKLAGVAVAPSSTGTGRSLYLVDRGVDNDSDPDENDGKLYEMTYETTATNAAPTVNAGADQTINFRGTATLDGSVVDDGRPAGATVATAWCLVSGPGTVTLANSRSPRTTATFQTAGTYVLRLEADDTDKKGSDDTTVVVRPSGSGVIDVPVATSNDDAEENGSTGQIARSGSDLELVADGASVQTVGLRFAGVGVPRNATITAAYVQFTVDEVTTAPASLTIQGQAVDNAATYTGARFEVSSRPRTTASAAWSPAAWSSVGQTGVSQRTSNLADVVRQITSRAGWASGNALTLVVTGSGVRTAESFDSGSPPVLHVEFTT